MAAGNATGTFRNARVYDYVPRYIRGGRGV